MIWFYVCKAKETNGIISAFATAFPNLNLAYANKKRSWQIFADFTYLLIAGARTCIAPNPELSDFDLMAMGLCLCTTTIDLCLKVFWWAKFRKHKAHVRLHTHLDVKFEIHIYINISDDKTHEVNILNLIKFEPLGIYRMDRAFINFSRLYSIHEHFAYFKTRAKTNIKLN